MREATSNWIHKFMLSNQQLHDLIDLRHALHRHPEISGEEFETAATIFKNLKILKPDDLITAIGGTGIAAIFDGEQDGETLLFRCELDGLPIEEQNGLDYVSENPMRGHLCGHDGHMTILVGLAMRLSEQRPTKGRVILLFQPAEETGKGAAAILADGRLADYAPDFAFALHNLPGLSLGKVWLKVGAMCCASRGLVFAFEGKTSHASMPQDGLSPDEALCQLMAGLNALSNGLNPGQGLNETYKLVTVTHINLGEPAFGIAPGSGEVWATLRTVTDDAMDSLVEEAESLARSLASTHGLQLSIRHDDVFEACTNAQSSSQMVEQALNSLGTPWDRQPDPMRFSEDFGQYGKLCPSTLFMLGSGETQPQLHNPDFDFPDALINISTQILEEIVRQRLG